MRLTDRTRCADETTAPNHSRRLAESTADRAAEYVVSLRGALEALDFIFCRGAFAEVVAKIGLYWVLTNRVPE